MKFEEIYKDFIYDVKVILARYEDKPDAAVQVLNGFIRQQEQDVLKQTVREEFELEISGSVNQESPWFDFTSKYDFVRSFNYTNRHDDFFREHFDELDEVMDIIRNEIKVLEDEWMKNHPEAIQEEGESNESGRRTEEA